MLLNLTLERFLTRPCSYILVKPFFIFSWPTQPVSGFILLWSNAEAQHEFMYFHAPPLHCPWALLWLHDPVQTAFHYKQTTVALNTSWTSVTGFALCRAEWRLSGLTRRSRFGWGHLKVCNSSHIPGLGTVEAVTQSALKGNVNLQRGFRITNNPDPEATIQKPINTCWEEMALIIGHINLRHRCACQSSRYLN